MLSKLKRLFKIQSYTPLTSDSTNIITFSTRTSSNGIGTNSEVLKLYQNLGSYGSSLIRTIIDYRKSWIVGNETTVTSEDQNTQLWINNFFQYNKFDVLIQKMALFSELEGKLLVALNVKREGTETKIKPILMPEYLYNYTLISNQYNEVEKVSYSVDNQEFVLNSDRFSYSKFYLLDSANQKNCPSIHAYIVKDCIAIDDLMNTWFEIIEKYKNPTLFFETQTKQDANSFVEMLKSKMPNGWKFGSTVAFNAKPQLIPFPLDKTESIEKAIIIILQKISSHTGIPVYLLGHPEITKSYATASETSESIKAKTLVERLLIKYQIEDIVNKSIVLYNNSTASNLVPNVTCTIPPASNTEIQTITNFYKDLFDRKVISKKTLQEIVPNLDPILETERLAEEEQENSNIISSNIQKGIEMVSQNV
jgi:hypothetical protein